MELLGIALSVPAAFLFSVVYGRLLLRFVWPLVPLRLGLRAASFVILGLILAEAVLLAAMGAVRLRQLCGPVCYSVHVILFFAGVPSLANVLLLRRTRPGWLHVLLVSAGCAAFALPVVLMQYGVSEALFGVD